MQNLGRQREGNSALLPANVERRPPLLLPLHVFLFVLCNKSLNDWSLGKQNELFPVGPVIKCLLFHENCPRGPPTVYTQLTAHL